MNLELPLLLCLVGIVLLYFAAGWMVKGSGSLARSLGVPPIVIGLTVVAFGTSAPELFVSVTSALQDSPMIAVTNVIGSNICNIALVLGLSVLFKPVFCDRSVRRRDIPLMLVISLVVVALCVDGALSRFEGAVLFAGVIAYTIFNYWVALRQKAVGRKAAVEEEARGIEQVESRTVQVLLILVGIVGVMAGAELVVTSAKKVMLALELSEKFVGLTMVAFGTSVPELATSLVAAIKGEGDLSIGNLVGSNVFNLLSVLGATALVAPIGFPGGFVGSGLPVAFGVMLVTSVMPLLLIRRTDRIGREAGVVLLLSYVAFVLWLVFQG
jgi:cation:H+ antiporter